MTDFLLYQGRSHIFCQPISVFPHYENTLQLSSHPCFSLIKKARKGNHSSTSSCRFSLSKLNGSGIVKTGFAGWTTAGAVYVVRGIGCAWKVTGFALASSASLCASSWDTFARCLQRDPCCQNCPRPPGRQVKSPEVQMPGCKFNLNGCWHTTSLLEMCQLVFYASAKLNGDFTCWVKQRNPKVVKASLR